MKKLLIIMAVALISVSAMAQKNSPEAKAEAVAKEMQQVLSLTDTDYTAVYKIHLEKVNSIKAAKESHGENKEAFKAEVKTIQKSTQAKLKEAIGKESMEKWNTHLKEKKASQKE